MLKSQAQCEELRKDNHRCSKIMPMKNLLLKSQNDINIHKDGDFNARSGV